MFEDGGGWEACYGEYTETWDDAFPYLDQDLGEDATWAKHQLQKQAGWSGGRFRARCQGQCCQSLVGQHLPPDTAFELTNTGITSGWANRRNDVNSLYYLIAALASWLEACVTTHFANLHHGLDGQGLYPRVSGLRKRVETVYHIFRRLHGIVIHLKKWRA